MDYIEKKEKERKKLPEEEAAKFRGKRVTSDDILQEALENPDKKLDKEVTKEVAQVNKAHRIAMFAEGLLLYNGNKTKSYKHAGLGGDPKMASISASKYYQRHQRKIQAYIRGEFNNTNLTQVGNAMKTVAEIMNDYDEKASNRLKAAEMVVKWSGMDVQDTSVMEEDDKETLKQRQDRMKALLNKALT